MNTSVSNQFMIRVRRKSLWRWVPVNQKELLNPEVIHLNGCYCISKVQIIHREQTIAEFHTFTYEHLQSYQKPAWENISHVSEHREQIPCLLITCSSMSLWNSSLSSAGQSTWVAKSQQSQVQKIWKHTSLRMLQAVKSDSSMCGNMHTNKGMKTFSQPKKVSGNTKDTLKGSFISLIPFHRHILKIDKYHKY